MKTYTLYRMDKEYVRQGHLGKIKELREPVIFTRYEGGAHSLAQALNEMETQYLYWVDTPPDAPDGIFEPQARTSGVPHGIYRVERSIHSDPEKKESGWLDAALEATDEH